MKGITISLRRHAETSKSAIEAKEGDIRMLSEEGKNNAYSLGIALRDNARRFPDQKIVGAFSAPHLRNQETLFYIMAGANRVAQLQEDSWSAGYDWDDEYQVCCRQMSSLKSPLLNEPVITPEYAQMKNVDAQGNPRGRTERFLWYLNNEDPAGASTTPYKSACEASRFITEATEKFVDGRVEAITSAPKQECFLHAFNPSAFEELRGGRTFEHLEAVDISRYGNVYVASFKGAGLDDDIEMQIPVSKLEVLANDKYVADKSILR